MESTGQKMSNSETENDRTAVGVPVNPVDEYSSEWGFDLEHLYKLCMRFYKEKEGKAVHLTYQNKLQLVALTKQVVHGPCSGSDGSVGFLDVVGNDRRQAWHALGDMPREAAMGRFVKQLDSLSPLLRPYISAHRTEKDERERKRLEAEERVQREEEERQRILLEQEAEKQQTQDAQKRAQQEMQIRAALNQQTDVQFHQYAEQQFPGDVEKQGNLIIQLQEQHFQQYMQQVYQQQIYQQQQLHQQQQQQLYQQQQIYQQQTQEMATSTGDSASPLQQEDVSLVTTDLSELSLSDREHDEVNEHPDNSSETEEDSENDDLTSVENASMWTRKDLKEFKDSLKKDKDAVIKVGSGETVTVRVPTHEDGTCLFWEFATDSYDIGFGVYFEWTIAPNNAVSVHVSESSDEDEEESEQGGKSDIEKGSKQDNKPPTDEIIPIYRRDCQDEVYCGSHAYPGQGVYLLKFDNSYSLWRSKTLYYRVYYTR